MKKVITLIALTIVCFSIVSCANKEKSNMRESQKEIQEAKEVKEKESKVTTKEIVVETKKEKITYKVTLHDGEEFMRERIKTEPLKTEGTKAVKKEDPKKTENPKEDKKKEGKTEEKKSTTSSSRKSPSGSSSSGSSNSSGSSHTPVITTEDITTTESIGYSSVSQNDPNTPVGESYISQNGQNGVRSIVTRVTYKDGVEVSREVVNSYVQDPINEIVMIGTYEAPPAEPIAGNSGMIFNSFQEATNWAEALYNDDDWLWDSEYNGYAVIPCTMTDGTMSRDKYTVDWF